MELLLPDDFKEFLRLLNSKGVEYLLIGGYAVGYHGYPHATADMDIWVGISQENARKIVEVLCEFGFGVEALTPNIFLQEDQVVRMGIPPLRLKILTTISGVIFSECYNQRIQVILDGVEVSLIHLAALKANKAASGRPKDLEDLKFLESLDSKPTSTSEQDQ